MTKIFISYSSSDHEYAQSLADELQKQNYDVWVDTEVQPGSDWRTEITQALQSSDAFVMIVSPESIARRNSLIELGMAWGLGKTIVPVLAPGASISDMELPLALQETMVIEAKQSTPSEVASYVGSAMKDEV